MYVLLHPNEVSVKSGCLEIADLIDVEGGMIGDKGLELLTELGFKRRPWRSRGGVRGGAVFRGHNE